MAQRISTFITVTLVSIVIWLYAEQANPATPLEVRFTLELSRPEGSDIIARFVEPMKFYTVTITGSTNELASLKRNFSGNLDKISLRVGDEIPSEMGERTYPLRELLAKHPWFARKPIIINEARLQTVRVWVDQWTDYDAPVEVGDLGNLSIVGGVQIDPPTVTIQVAQSVRAALGAADIKVIADPPTSSLTTAVEGQAQTIEAPVHVDGTYANDQVRLGPGKKVRLTFTVASRSNQITWGPVPIKLVILPRDQMAYDIVLTSPVINEITLEGPSDLIAKVQSNEIKVFAHLELDSLDLANGITSKEVSFAHLGKLKVVSGPHKVEFKIIKRDTGDNQP